MKEKPSFLKPSVGCPNARFCSSDEKPEPGNKVKAKLVNAHEPKSNKHLRLPERRLPILFVESMLLPVRGKRKLEVNPRPEKGTPIDPHGSSKLFGI